MTNEELIEKQEEARQHITGNAKQIVDLTTKHFTDMKKESDLKNYIKGYIHSCIVTQQTSMIPDFLSPMLDEASSGILKYSAVLAAGNVEEHTLFEKVINEALNEMGDTCTELWGDEDEDDEE